MSIIKKGCLSILFYCLLSTNCYGRVSDLSPTDILLIPSAIKDAIADRIKEEKQDRNWLNEQEILIKRKDIQASVNCIYIAHDFEYGINLLNDQLITKLKNSVYKNINKNILAYQQQCIETVLNAWQTPENPQQALTLFILYQLLSVQAENKNNHQQARDFQIQALSYIEQIRIIDCYYDGLEHPASPSISQCAGGTMRVEYQLYRHRYHIYPIDNLLDTLNKLKILDEENRACVYPDKIKQSMPQDKKRQFFALNNGCNIDKPLLEKRKWRIFWDNESYPQQKVETDCTAIKNRPATVEGVLIFSSHPDGQGMIYRSEPYEVYQDGCLIKKQLTNDDGEIIFNYFDDSAYVIKLVYSELLIMNPPGTLRSIKRSR